MQWEAARSCICEVLSRAPSLLPIQIFANVLWYLVKEWVN